jgi:phage terminase small subunit
MPVLKNTRHEIFAQELARGRSATDAYEAAGYKRDSGHSSRLAAIGRIRERVTELKEGAALRVGLERADVLAMLMQERELARERGQLSAAIRATELIGRELGMFVERSEVGAPGDFRRMSDQELHAQVNRLGESLFGNTMHASKRTSH